MAVLLTGGTGLIGKNVAKKLSEKGFDVHVLTRSEQQNSEKIKYFTWDIEQEKVEQGAFENVEYVIHLAGASIAKRWTNSYQKTLINSRVNSANLIYKKLKERNQRLMAYIGASASGIYPANTGELMNEEYPIIAANFLGEIGRNWENSARQFNDIAERVVINRIGIVLAKDGGALEKIIPPFYINIAPYFGGKQFYAWVHIDDIANQFVFSIENKIEGIFNANTGNITQRKLHHAIARAMNKKVLHLPTPIFILQLAMGNMRTIVTDSIQMDNSKIKTAGFQPEFTTIDKAMKAIFNS